MCHRVIATSSHTTGSSLGSLKAYWLACGNELTLIDSLLLFLPATPIMLHLQVFAVYMLLKHAAEYEALPGRGAKTAADKTQLTPAPKDAAAMLDCFRSLLGALTEDELMQMGLPALRLAPQFVWP